MMERENTSSALSTCALLIVDLQNDFLHPDGAYARGGATSEAIAALPARIKPLADMMRQGGGWVISTQFTLAPGQAGEPFISEPVSYTHLTMPSISRVTLRVVAVVIQQTDYQNREKYQIVSTKLKTTTCH